MACMCGHAEEEHGHDPDYPGSSACTVEDCDCVAYDPDTDYENDGEGGEMNLFPRNSGPARTPVTPAGWSIAKMVSNPSGGATFETTGEPK